MTRRTVNLVNKKYVGLQENIICFHYGKIGHCRCTCPLRKNAIERIMLYVKQMWIRKDELTSMLKKVGPKWIWVPKTNT